MQRAASERLWTVTVFATKASACGNGLAQRRGDRRHEPSNKRGIRVTCEESPLFEQEERPSFAQSRQILLLDQGEGLLLFTHGEVALPLGGEEFLATVCVFRGNIGAGNLEKLCVGKTVQFSDDM
jgi:hypothetical protein